MGLHSARVVDRDMVSAAEVGKLRGVEHAERSSSPRVQAPRPAPRHHAPRDTGETPLGHTETSFIQITAHLPFRDGRCDGVQGECRTRG
jgi:hypothetical protein